MASVLCLPAGGVKCHSCARHWKSRDAHDMFITSLVQPEPEPGLSPEPICRAGAGLPTTPKSERHYFHQNETHTLDETHTHLLDDPRRLVFKQETKEQILSGNKEIEKNMSAKDHSLFRTLLATCSVSSKKIK